MTISIIIPAKDEQERLPRFLRRVIDYCKGSKHHYEIIVVDDGSTDQTAAAALDFQKEFPSIKVLSLNRNHGKGYAVKRGFYEAKGDIVLFLDADGSTPPDEIERHLPFFDQGFDIVIGSRALEDDQARVKTLSYRKWMGVVFNFLVSRLLIKGIKDTQCGFKMFRSSVISPLFGRVYLKGFGFDLELLYVAQKLNLKIKEVAVSWTHVEGSKIRLFSDSLKMFWNIIQIKNWHYLPINLHSKHMSAKEIGSMYLQEKEHWWFKAKGEFFKNILSDYNLDQKSILDAGCGTGHNMDFLRNKGFYVGSDVMLEALEFCQNNGIKNLVQADLQKMAIRSKSFDVIISLDVVEHVPNPIAVIGEFKRMLKEDGMLLIAVPAFRFLWSPHDESISHMRRFSKKDLTELLQDNGFHVDKIGFLYAVTFLPAALIRVIRKVFVNREHPESDTFDQINPWLNQWLFKLLKWEAAQIRHSSWPFGTSLYAVATLRK